MCAHVAASSPWGFVRLQCNESCKHVLLFLIFQVLDRLCTTVLRNLPFWSGLFVISPGKSVRDLYFAYTFVAVVTFAAYMSIIVPRSNNIKLIVVYFKLLQRVIQETQFLFVCCIHSNAGGARMEMRSFDFDVITVR